MLAEPLTVVVGADTFNCVRIQPLNGRSRFKATKADGSLVLTVQVDHTVPTKVGNVHQHMMRGDLVGIDTSTGLSTGTSSFWLVLRTSGKAQDATQLRNLAEGVVEAVFGGALSTPSYTVVDDLLEDQP